MSRAPTKVQRLMRLNAFHEERADGALRIAVAQQTQAEKKHASATTDIDRLGEWKTRGATNSALDLTVYAAALELERLAMARADALKKELLERERSTQQARDVLNTAASATRVSTKRGKREALSAESEREKRTFDQISDVWLNNREQRRD
ncbi:MAG TPA: hypothetical protein VK660_10665 [Xanthomonadaceae bacterium]|jgi:phage terminase large subunit GpA-like protein|nr:hypothetical protein [Xanthomonadaceae bacterium]